MDAEATTIQVNLKNYGLDSVQVVDNGSGIDQENFDALGKLNNSETFHTRKPRK